MQDLTQYRKKTHIEIQTKYITLLLSGSTAMIGLVFAVGVLVGSRRAPESTCKSDDPLAALDRRSGEPEPPSIQNIETRSFYNSLTVATEAVPTPASLINVVSSDAQNARIESEDLTNVSLKYPRHREMPIPEKVTDAEPGTYSLQVASFQDQREASLMVKKLERAGHTAFLVSVNMPERGGIWYRVRVGPFSSKKTAWGYKKSFEAKEKLPVFVVKRASKNTSNG